MSTPPSFLTPEQYLEIERRAEFKSEYYQGEMFAMAGARRNHNLLVTNTVGQIHAQLRHRECEVYSNDMRVRVAATGLYAYPDIVIACGPIEFLDANEDPLLNPTVIMEVLSASTKPTIAARSSSCTARSIVCGSTCWFHPTGYRSNATAARLGVSGS